MPYHLDLSDAMDVEVTLTVLSAVLPVTLHQSTPHRYLRKGEAVVAPNATKARIPRLILSRLYPAEERLEGQVQPHRHVLQDLRVDTGQRWALRFEHGQRRLLVVEAQRLLALLPGVAPFGQQVIPQPAALLQLPREEPLLFFGRVQAV